MEETQYIVWVDTQNKVASFHEICTGERVSFIHHEHFMAYIESLIAKRFRFQ